MSDWMVSQDIINLINTTPDFDGFHDLVVYLIDNNKKEMYEEIMLRPLFYIEYMKSLKSERGF